MVTESFGTDEDANYFYFLNHVESILYIHLKEDLQISSVRINIYLLETVHAYTRKAVQIWNWDTYFVIPHSASKQNEGLLCMQTKFP